MSSQSSSKKKALPYLETDPEDVKLTKILLDGYAKSILELQKNQEYIDWYNNLGLIEKGKIKAFMNLVTPSAKQIIEGYEGIFSHALEIVKDDKNRNRLLVKKQWFDKTKAKFFKLKPREEEEKKNGQD